MKIWKELSIGYGRYHVVARNRSLRYRSFRIEGIHVHLLPSVFTTSWEFVVTSFWLLLLAARHRPSVLLTQSPVIGGIAGAVCSVLLRIPLCVELHGEQYLRPRRSGLGGRLEHLVFRSLAAWPLRVAAAVRSLSDEMTTAILAVYGERLRDKVVVVPPRVDLRTFGDGKSSYDVGSLVRIITVGALSVNKNHLRLLVDLYESQIPFELTIVGDGPLLVECQRLAEELSVGERLHVPGRMSQTDVAILLKAHDVYVHYSRSEAVSRAILEAMAIGLPVVATRVGFMGGILEHEQNCLLVDPSEPGQLAASLSRLASSGELRQRLGRQARETIQSGYEWGSSFDRYRRMIASVES